MKRGACYKVSLLVALLVGTAAGQTFATLAYFTNDDGSGTFSPLIQGRDDNYYGVAALGGSNGSGTVFKLMPTGVVTALYTLCGQPGCSDGSIPSGTLALGADGDLYGTTVNGGSANLGTVFKITPKGTLTVLHSFQGTDGSLPTGLLLASDGNFYGTTLYGGPNSLCPCGTVFRMTMSGTVTTLHSFGLSDGNEAEAPLIQGSDGSLYGTTAYGGSSNVCSGGCGTVFKVTTTGVFTSLHSFGYSDGSEPEAPLVQAASGGFYGTTFSGGDSNIHGCVDGCGTIFKISSTGAFATVHKFDGNDGGGLESGLAQGTDGGLYGGNPRGGADPGQIFELNLPATITDLHTFQASSGGGGATALLQATNGEFYGTYGSAPAAAFSLNVGLGPFVAFVIPTGKTGQSAQILGQGLTGTTGVTFNGVPATSFKVVSDTFMTAVVPSGATTGPVVVTTPSGGLTSNVSFRIAK